MAFLSEWDPRKRPKGSRDPLGFELVWSHYGRKVIGNLTTVTGSLENFSVALLGFYWANELNATSVGTAKERSQRIKETFLCYEQLAGYLRYYIHKTEENRGESILGSRRIKSRIENNKSQITLGSEDEQILSSQMTLGLWGLYYSAMKATGLVKDDDRSLTDNGKEIAQLIEQKLGPDAVKLKKLLEKNPKPVKKEELKKQCNSFFEAIRDPKACGKLLRNLMRGSNRSNRSNKDEQLAEVQIALWEATLYCLKNRRSNFISKEGWWLLGSFIREVKEKTENKALINRLTAIESAERLLVAIDNLFRYCQRKNGVELSEVVKEISNKKYDYAKLPDPDQLKGAPYGEKLKAIRNDLVDDNIEQAITRILELNKAVMKERGGTGAPWVEIEKNKTLLVRVPDEIAELLNKDVLKARWDNSYFLYSYLNVAKNWKWCSNG